MNIKTLGSRVGSLSGSGAVAVLSLLSVDALGQETMTVTAQIAEDCSLTVPTSYTFDLIPEAAMEAVINTGSAAARTETVTLTESCNLASYILRISSTNGTDQNQAGGVLVPPLGGLQFNYSVTYDGQNVTFSGGSSGDISRTQTDRDTVLGLTYTPIFNVQGEYTDTLTFTLATGS